MEAIAVIGLAGSVFGIVDVITKSIVALKNVQAQWKAADWTVTSIIAQLTTLKAALNQISRWISTDLATEPQHYQLVLDLDDALESCKALILFIDGHLSRLEWTDTESLTFESRMKAVLNDGGVKECVNHLSNQTNALNLLLTALNCQSISGQKSLLEAKESRRVLDQVKDDSSSLICLRDTASCNSSWTKSTGRFSLLSRVFAFDHELLDSKVYQNHVKSLIKKAVRTSRNERHGSERRVSSAERRRRSEEVENQLKRDKLCLRNEIRILVQGPNSGRLALLLMLETRSGYDCDWETRQELPKKIQARTADSMLSFVQKNERFLEELPECADLVRTIRSVELNDHSYLAPAIFDDISALWKIPIIKRTYGRSGDPLCDEADKYFFDSIARVSSPHYCPTHQDVIMANVPRHDGIKEISCIHGELQYRFVCPTVQILSKSFSAFDNTEILIFVADLASRYQPRIKEGRADCLEESLEMFGALMWSKWFVKSGIILLLNGSDLFRQELAVVPLSHHFPDYHGLNSYDEACKYVSDKFVALNRHADRNIYTEFVNLTREGDQTAFRYINAAICDHIIAVNVKNLSLDASPQTLEPESAV